MRGMARCAFDVMGPNEISSNTPGGPLGDGISVAVTFSTFPFLTQLVANAFVAWVYVTRVHSHPFSNGLSTWYFPTSYHVPSKASYVKFADGAGSGHVSPSTVVAIVVIIIITTTTIIIIVRCSDERRSNMADVKFKSALPM